MNYKSLLLKLLDLPKSATFIIVAMAFLHGFNLESQSTLQRVQHQSPPTPFRQSPPMP